MGTFSSIFPLDVDVYAGVYACVIAYFFLVFFFLCTLGAFMGYRCCYTGILSTARQLDLLSKSCKATKLMSQKDSEQIRTALNAGFECARIEGDIVSDVC